MSDLITLLLIYVLYREFEKNASGLLRALYEIDQDKAHELLRRPLTTWKGSSVLELADTGDRMDFMEQECCQTKLDKIWHGKLSTRTRMWQVR